MGASPAKARVLVVDDEPNVLATVCAILQQEGYEVHATATGGEAITAIQSHYYDLVLTDLKMPGIDGLQVLAEVRRRSPDTVTIMMTGYATLDSALEAVQLGAYEYLLKPTEVAQLKLAVARSLERKRLSEIDTLYRTSLAMTSQLEPDPAVISAQVSEAVCRVLGIADACVVTLNRQFSSGCPVWLADVLSQPELLAHLARGTSVTTANRIPAVREWAARADIAAYIFMPGIAHQRLVSVLFASNGNKPYDFHASALRFVRALSCQAALALENAALIRELKGNNETLLVANRRLKELDTLKSQFLNVATHELRTPLTVILGYISMLAETLDQKLNQDERETLTESVAACKRLIRLVNSMLDMAQIEAGKMKMEFAPADLRALINSVTALFQHEAHIRKITLSTVLPQRLPRITMDAERIQQVLINLIANALKFTPEKGKVRLQVRHRADQQRVVITVRDTGPGISAENQAKIFHEFAQVRRQATLRQKTGSGLGLAIARRIVEAHEGSISVYSRLLEGSTFTVVLPIQQSVLEPRAVSA